MPDNWLSIYKKVKLDLYLIQLKLAYFPIHGEILQCFNYRVSVVCLNICFISFNSSFLVFLSQCLLANLVNLFMWTFEPTNLIAHIIFVFFKKYIISINQLNENWHLNVSHPYWEQRIFYYLLKSTLGK